MRELAELVVRIAELERRFANMMRHGTVEQVDAKKQRLRIRLGEGDDGAPFIGPWVPYAQLAGDLKLHTPPSKGQQMTMLNPTGDFRQAVAIPLTWSDRNQSPSEKPDEHVLTFGSVRVTLKESELEFKVGDDARLLMTADKIVAEVGQTKLGVKSAAVYSVKTTRLGLDDEGEVDSIKPKVLTAGGEAKQTEAKVA
jgi:phage baseplate assembly protein V